jgi:hypothetical protein
MMNANQRAASPGLPRHYPGACYRELPCHASAEFDLPADPEEEDFDDDEEDDDDSDRLQPGLDAEWR